MSKENKISDEEIAKILEVYIKAKEEKGKKVTTAILMHTDEEDPKIVYDARKKEDIN